MWRELSLWGVGRCTLIYDSLCGVLCSWSGFFSFCRMDSLEIHRCTIRHHKYDEKSGLVCAHATARQLMIANFVGYQKSAAALPVFVSFPEYCARLEEPTSYFFPMIPFPGSLFGYFRQCAIAARVQRVCLKKRAFTA